MMIFATLIVCILALITIFICNKIGKQFDLKSNMLLEKEKELYNEQQELRKRRKELRKDITLLKNDIQVSAQKDSKNKDEDPSDGDLKSWLLNNNYIESEQFSTARQFADEKNMRLLSSLLTLNMISLDTYEQAKKLKLK